MSQINNNQNIELTIIVGHYGSGKTEFSVNYAMYMQKHGKKVAIADLDIINPYFRTREITDELEKEGIRVISSVLGNKASHPMDLPSLSPELNVLTQTNQYFGIIDVGGNPVGATALGRFSDRIQQIDYKMYMVVNANRPETNSVETVVDFMNAIEEKSKLKINGLINNTHLVRETTPQDILNGDKLIREVSEYTSLPVMYCSYIEAMVNMDGYEVAGEKFPMKLLMRPEWL
jgi:Mrp family chromosome partitioning ATPase